MRHVRRAELQALLVTPVLTAASDEQVPVELPVWPVQMDLSQRIASTVLKQTMGKRRRRMDQHKWHARQDMRARVGCASSARLGQCRPVRGPNVSHVQDGIIVQEARAILAFYVTLAPSRTLCLVQRFA